MIPPNRLVISSISAGLQTYDKPWLLDNTAFPTLDNALCWRKRLIKKPGSGQLGRLQRKITSTSDNPVMTLDGSGDGTANLISVFSLESTSSIAPGYISLTDGTNTFSEPTLPDGTLIGTPAGSGTINYATGDIAISGGAAGQEVTGNFGYYPGLPAMGIEEFESDSSPTSQVDFPVNIYFDTVYSYQFNGVFFIDNSFYKSGAPVTWSGQNYQQFYSCNYYRAMFVTNNNPGAQFLAISSITDGTPTTFTSTLDHGLITGDYIFVNEVTGSDADIELLNMQTFQVTVTGANTFTVPVNTSNALSGGAVQILQKNSPNGFGDGIRWYDGLGTGLGFANFAPPLDNLSTSATTYLIGCRMIIPFGNRLIAIGTFEATSAQILSGSSGVYSGNRMRYCEVTATPFYATAPQNVGVEPLSWVSNIQGYGGFIDLDTTQRIISAAITQGSLILGLEYEQRKVTNTGIETDPYSLQVINPDFGSAGTYATVPMDQGILTVGEYGFIITSSYDSKRFDIPIIDQIFQVNANNQGFERICGARDFANEVIYFSYPSLTATNVFPNQTLVYNYREASFALWYDNATTYGIYKSANETWSSLINFTWQEWQEPWQSGEEVDVYPYAAFGTAQGFVMLRWYSDSTNNPSILINAISGNSITSNNHSLNAGMYLGLCAIGNETPYAVGQVVTVTDANTFVLDNVSGLVAGLSSLCIVDQPFIQTKEFPPAWGEARKTRIGAQKYFLDTTLNGEFTVQILGSQSPIPLNDNTVANPLPSLISNAIVRTRPDDSLGLNDSAQFQAQIWHRLASSCIGDTVQLQMTFSDAQMRNVNIAISPWVLHSIILDLYPSRTLA